MNIFEAIEALNDGKKIRCQDWGVDEYVYFNSKDETIEDENGENISLSLDSYSFRVEYKIYEEPEKLMSLYQSCRLLNEGKKVKRKNWQNAYISRDPISHQMLYYSKFRAYDVFWSPLIDDLLADDWVEVTDV